MAAYQLVDSASPSSEASIASSLSSITFADTTALEPEAFDGNTLVEVQNEGSPRLPIPDFDLAQLGDNDQTSIDVDEWSQYQLQETTFLERTINICNHLPSIEQLYQTSQERVYAIKVFANLFYDLEKAKYRADYLHQEIDRFCHDHPEFDGLYLLANLSAGTEATFDLAWRAFTNYAETHGDTVRLVNSVHEHFYGSTLHNTPSPDSIELPPQTIPAPQNPPFAAHCTPVLSSTSSSQSFCGPLSNKHATTTLVKSNSRITAKKPIRFSPYTQEHIYDPGWTNPYAYADWSSLKCNNKKTSSQKRRERIRRSAGVEARKEALSTFQKILDTLIKTVQDAV